MNTVPRSNGSLADSDSPGPWSSAPWAPFIVPFVVYGVVGAFEPLNPPEANWLGFTVAYEHYPLLYTIKIAATIAALAFFWPAYRSPSLWGQSSPTPGKGANQQSPSPVRGGGGNHFRISPLALLVGLLGAVLWIALCYVDLEKLLTPLGIGDWFARSDRPAFNPFDELKSNPAWMYGFLAIRFIGLVLVVAMMEELFLRGFLMRFVMHANWPQVPFGEVNKLAIAVGTLVPIFTHPLSEALAVVAWFTLITLLMIKTKNFWDCVTAHAITNLVLGIYVVVTAEWWLW